MSDIASKALSVTMIFAPTFGYFDQYRIICKNKTSLGFNSATCAILCFSNILRLFFWLGDKFDITLLFQSIVMLSAMLFLLHGVVEYKPTNIPFTSLIQHDSTCTLDHYHPTTALEQIAELKWYQRSFWDWDNYLDYINCLLTFTCLVGFVYIFLHKYSTFIEILGFLSLGLESTLPLPQLLTNYKHRNTDGFSIFILGSWFIGDGFKAFYFFFTKSPIQFVVCAIIQLSFDIVLVFQLIMFSTTVKKWLGTKNAATDNNNQYEPIA